MVSRSPIVSSTCLQDSINCYSTTFEVSTCETCTGVSACGWKIAPVCPALILHHCNLKYLTSRSLTGTWRWMNMVFIHNYTRIYAGVFVVQSLAWDSRNGFILPQEGRVCYGCLPTDFVVIIGFISATNWHIFLPDSSSSDGANRAGEFDISSDCCRCAMCWQALWSLPRESVSWKCINSPTHPRIWHTKGTLKFELRSLFQSFSTSILLFQRQVLESQHLISSHP